MKRLLILLIISSFILGCATTSKRFPQKAKIYTIPFYEGVPDFERTYEVIGNLQVEGNTSDGTNWKSVYDKAVAIAKQRGAEAVINVKSEYQPYHSVTFSPGYTTYHSTTTHHSYGRHHVTHTRNVPIHHPPTIIPYNAAILRYRGDLIVFQNQDF